MVHLAMKYLDKTGSSETKLSLLHTLCQVTEGKIFVEVERARLILIESDMLEAKGEVEAAAVLLQEVQVETFSGMDGREKTEYILQQMRLLLLKKDYVRTQIISRKVSPKLLNADEMQDLKIRYYQYLVELFLYEEAYLDVAKSYQAILNTPKTQEDAETWKPVLQSLVLFLMLAPYENESQDLLHKLNTMESKKLESIPLFENLLEGFLKKELLAWPLQHQSELKNKHPVFTDNPYFGGKKRWARLHKCVVQKNITVLAGYYSRLTMERLCSLLCLSADEAEAELSELISSKFVVAKIDRPLGIITFGAKLDSQEQLDNWANDIQRLLNLVEECGHLLYKEQMINAARVKQKQSELKNA
eukprot:Platyproteum_vivax@DN12004_c0_g1_i1.p1